MTYNQRESPLFMNLRPYQLTALEALKQHNKGVCVLPTGSGKTTIVKHLLATNETLAFSISACTRDKRGRSEQDGKDYYFISASDFKSRIKNKDFLSFSFKLFLKARSIIFFMPNASELQ